MEKITDKKRINRLILLFTLLYTVSYLTRINYAAVISEIVTAEGMQKSLASLALTISAVTYGVGQLLSGYLGDKFEPKKLIFTGLMITISANIIVPFCSSPYSTAFVWGINGIAQAFMWPPLVKIMISIFTEGTYKKACVYVAWGSSVGTILVYLLAPLCIHFSGWRAIFYLSASFAIIMSVFWIKYCPKINSGLPKSSENEKAESVQNHSLKPFLFMLPIMLAIVLQGILRDSVMTWMPSYISDCFNLSNKIAILTSVVLPLFDIGAKQITAFVYQKHIKNELTLCCVLFALALISAAVLYAFGSNSAVLAIFFAAILSGCIHGVNLIATCMVPTKYQKYGHLSLISGTLNFSAYIGSSISASGMALFSESFGWQSTILLWSLLAGLGALICGIICKSWRRFANS